MGKKEGHGSLCVVTFSFWFENYYQERAVGKRWKDIYSTVTKTLAEKSTKKYANLAK